MKIGDYEIHSIETGTFVLDGGAMFGIVPKTIWDRKIPADEKNRIDMALRCLLIVGNKRKILVDVGIGDKCSEKFTEIYKIDLTNCNIRQSIKEYGLTVEDITDVILTHFHFDHVGGATYVENGNLRLVFPNATYYIQNEHYTHARNPSEKDKGSFRNENFEPLEEAGKLKIISGEFEIFPGVSLLVSNGHTVGQQLVKVSNGVNTLVYCADLIPTSAHIPIPYVMSYDLYPLVTIEEKKKLLRNASEGNWILFFEHDPLVEAVKVRKGEKGFEISEIVKL
ncbi:MAG: MBL fold metallo-hydrolase [Candidatus Anammoxibacter sp.]